MDKDLFSLVWIEIIWSTTSLFNNIAVSEEVKNAEKILIVLESVACMQLKPFLNGI